MSPKGLLEWQGQRPGWWGKRLGRAQREVRGVGGLLQRHKQLNIWKFVGVSCEGTRENNWKSVERGLMKGIGSIYPCTSGRTP
eukprot:718213-Pelagomonas_calceolata.AAC.1